MTKLTRRQFARLAGAGILAGCGRTLPRPSDPAQGETAADATSATPAVPPPEPQMAATEAAPSESALSALVAPTFTPRQVGVMSMYPDGPSKVVHTHHAGVWSDEELVTEALDEMLDASITELTGLNDTAEAWAALFSPEERVAIKVNAVEGSRFYTRFPLVVAIADRLQEVGIPVEQIIVFDRYTAELERCGFPTNEDGPGVRCYGTDLRYTSGWSLMAADVMLSDILLSCDALINMPVIKQHSGSGISFAMKSHYGTFDCPAKFHGARLGRAIAEVNALPAIKSRTRLIIGDALKVSTRSWYSGVPGDSILMAFDPVAHDTVGLQLYEEVMTSEGLSAAGAVSRANQWLENGAELGVGTNDRENIELVEVVLG